MTNSDNLLKLISSDGFITLNKSIIKTLGLHESILLGELASKYNYWKEKDGLTEDGYFFCTIDNIKEETSLSGSQQRNAVNHLVKEGIISCRVVGIPAKRYFKINEKQLLNKLTS